MWYEFIIGILVILIIIFIVIVSIQYSRGALTTVGPQGPPGATGPAGTTKSYITFNPGANYITTNFQFFGSQTPDPRHASIVISDPGFLSNLFVKNADGVGGPSAIRGYFIDKNFTPTNLQVQLTGSQTQGVNNTITVPVVPGDLISLRYVEAGIPVSTTGSMTFTINS
jgi:hypothetical protein